MKIKAKKVLPYIGWPLAGLGGLILLSEELKQIVKPWIAFLMVGIGLTMLVAATEPEKKVSAPEKPNPKDKDNIAEDRKDY